MWGTKERYPGYVQGVSRVSGTKETVPRHAYLLINTNSTHKFLRPMPEIL